MKPGTGVRVKAVMSTTLVQVEFDEVLFETYELPGAAGVFCSAVSGALNATVVCNTQSPILEDGIFLAGVQFQVVNPLHLKSSATTDVNDALVGNNWYLPYLNPRVSDVALYYHPDGLVIGMSVAQFVLMCLFTLLAYFAHFPTDRMKKPLRTSA